jgi:hypothetical protein
MLTVVTGATPNDGTGGIVQRFAGSRHALAIALHLQLLQVVGKIA